MSTKDARPMWDRFIRASDLPPAQRLVLLALSDRSGDGPSTASVETLAKDARVTRKVVVRALEEATRRGWIATTRRRGTSAARTRIIAAEMVKAERARRAPPSRSAPPWDHQAGPTMGPSERPHGGAGNGPVGTGKVERHSTPPTGGVFESTLKAVSDQDIEEVRYLRELVGVRPPFNVSWCDENVIKVIRGWREMGLDLDLWERVVLRSLQSRPTDGIHSPRFFDGLMAKVASRRDGAA